MKEKATIYDYARMCNFYKTCTDCPMREMDCGFRSSVSDAVDKTNEIVLKWSKEHPVKTRQDKFLEMFPNASLHNTFIDIYPCKVDYNCDCKNINGHYGEFDCYDCKKSYWLEEVEE